MDKSFADIVTDEMKSMMMNLRQETREMFKGKQPYRAVKMDDATRIASYLTMPPEVRQQLQNDYGAGYENYANNMEELIAKYRGGDLNG